MTRTLGWTLLHFLWQGAAVASVLACLNLALRRSAPQARYVLACGSLLLMLSLPALTFRVLSAAPATLEAKVASVGLAGVAVLDDATPSSAASLPAAASLGRRIEASLPGLVALWGAGVLLLCLRSLGGIALVRRLGRAGLSAPPAVLEATMARLATRWG